MQSGLEQVEGSPSVPRASGRRLQTLEFLEYLFKALVVLNEAYLHMYPIPPQHPPCTHVPHQQGPGHLTEMAGQGERMAFVGMLLRSADQIRYFKLQSSRYNQDFASKVKELKDQRPEIAHGVAVLNSLMAGVCQNRQVLRGILFLLQKLKKASESCDYNHYDINTFKIYTRNNHNCTLTLFNMFLDQYTKARCQCYKDIQDTKERLLPHLDPSRRNSCDNCESILVDILVYANMLQNANRRMMGSLRVSLKCIMNQRQSQVQVQYIQQLVQCLISEGFTNTRHKVIHGPNLEILADYETIFISGWQEEKHLKGPMRLMLETFLEQSGRRRLFFIQWKHQVTGNDGYSHCCEPQIMNHLNVILKIPAMAHLTHFTKVHMMLEQDPCRDCRNIIMPAILNQLGDHMVTPQLVTMLPYICASRSLPPELQPPVFLQRLVRDGPVQLKNDLRPFEERYLCMVCERCGHVRCHEHCHYSKPRKVLAVIREKLRKHKLHISHQIPAYPAHHTIMWFTPPLPHLL